MAPRMFLNESFYQRINVVKIARELLGKGLFTNMEGTITGGMIVETEAYSRKEKGCHAYKNRMTARNEVMFRNGGLAYVYLCYGIHHLFNIVTNGEGEAEAVLVRALEPVTGIEKMMMRMKTDQAKRITSGPGKLTKALSIGRRHNGVTLHSDDLWIADLGKVVTNPAHRGARCRNCRTTTRPDH